MFDANNDPLGNALRGRATDRRFRYAQEHPGSSFGPLPDSKWDAYFQSMDEAGVSRVGDSSTKPGFGSQFGTLPSTYDPSRQQSAVETMPSNQIGVPGQSMPLGSFGDSIGSMDALTRVTGGGVNPRQGFRKPKATAKAKGGRG